MPPITTTVADTIYAPDGSKPTGRMLVSTNSTWTTADGYLILQGFTLWVAVVDGVFSVNLCPNNLGSTYTTKMETTQGYFMQVWNVPRPSGSPPVPATLLQVVVG